MARGTKRGTGIYQAVYVSAGPDSLPYTIIQSWLMEWHTAMALATSAAHATQRRHAVRKRRDGEGWVVTDVPAWLVAQSGAYGVSRDG